MAFQQQITNGLFIRKEIQRFESVHPNIYSIYDLIDTIADFNLQQQIREHIVNIEDSFVNSQEWTLSRSVQDLKLGILGSTNSGKSSLVHRFLTGTYMQEESPEGGRFKKEVVIDNQSYLLLLRDEGGQPEMQFTHWVDAVIFVFSLESDESFALINQYYQKMTHYRNMNDVPLILVGTQDNISASNPRLIDDNKARHLANELKKCSYFETCATYGLHVERVFHEACQKVINTRHIRYPTPNVDVNSTPNIRNLAGSHVLSIANREFNSSNSTSTLGLTSSSSNSNSLSPSAKVSSNNLHNPSVSGGMGYYVSHPHLMQHASSHAIQHANNALINNLAQAENVLGLNQDAIFKEPYSMQQSHFNGGVNSSDKKFNPTLNRLAAENNNFHKELLQENNKTDTPISTPNQKRKENNRRRSNLFTPNKKEDKQTKLNDMGIGRSIPIKQGFLYKKTNSTINKDWKKKFVTLNDDGSLRYYPSMNDYMEDTHGKEIDLQKTTVKIPGSLKPRIAKSIPIDQNRLNNDIHTLNLYSNGAYLTHGVKNDKNSLNDDNQTNNTTEFNSKKRHRRIKSNHKSDQNKEDEQEGFEFIILSLDNKQWNFEATSAEEREEWVQAVEQQILNSLQLNDNNKNRTKNGGLAADNDTILNMKNLPGNSACADCDAPNPVWASLNLGALICIECSGIHRNLGTHLSRVRSLELDDWSNEFIQVMTSIGNKLINNIYEVNLTMPKPNQNSSREDKEKFIRAKYEAKEFFLQNSKEIPMSQQILNAVIRQDFKTLLTCLALCKPDDLNACLSENDKRTCLHIAASNSNLVMMQLLIWYGADVESIDSSGRNAFDYAKMSNSHECVQLLNFYGSSDSKMNEIVNE